MVVVCVEKTSGDDDLLLCLDGCGGGICTAGGGGVDFGVSGLMWVEENGGMCSGVGGVEYGSVYSWQNPESTQARRTRGLVTEDEPKIFGDDAIPRPSVAPQKAKAKRSSSSSATSCSSKAQITELMQQQILLDREAKKESMDHELSARLAVCEIQKRNERLEDTYFRHYRDEYGGHGEDRGFERRGLGYIL
ncbi:hypothetical protein Tco_1467876 [Tanacetum coccineum]